MYGAYWFQVTALYSLSLPELPWIYQQQGPPTLTGADNPVKIGMSANIPPVFGMGIIRGGRIFFFQPTCFTYLRAAFNAVSAAFFRFCGFDASPLTYCKVPRIFFTVPD